MIYFEINWLLSFVALSITSILLFKLNIISKLIKLLESYNVFLNSYLSKEEDSLKLKKIISSFKIIIILTFNLICIIVLILLPICILYIFGLVRGINFWNYIISYESFIFTFVIFIILSKIFKNKKRYNRYDQTIHKLILNNKLISSMMFDIEKKIFYKKKNIGSKKLFICGYARSGTTIILNTLYSSGYFTSLLYRDLPFILSPSINKFFIKFTNLNKKNKKYERSHLDGLYIDADTPEALEEVFWKVKLQDSYIENDYLKKNIINSETLNEFEKYITLINNLDKIYLSKNNNNILRIEQLANLKNSKIIIMIREPYFHAKSLLTQHISFCKQQNDDLFFEDYMNSIGHHEFGNNQKSFFSAPKIANKENLSFWLSEWKKVYSIILKEYLELNKNNIFFVTYEGFSSNKDLFIEKINNLLNIDIKNKDLMKNRNHYSDVISNIDDNKILLDECNDIYEKIKKISLI